MLLVVGVCAVVADDVMWMELMSSQIVDAENDKGAVADKNIPELANDLGLKILLEAVKRANLTDTLSGTGMYYFVLNVLLEYDYAYAYTH